MNWEMLFGFTVPPLELVVRGTCVFWFLFAVFRLVLRRGVGAIGIADILVVVLIADASQNAMAGDYRSISDGVVLIGTIVGWNFLVDWGAYRSARIARILEPPPLLLVHHGQVLHRNLRSEFLSVDELMGKLREKGVESLAEVRYARLESDGEISVTRNDGGTPPSLRKSGARPR
jgi:uncharacterized membrane protein YcaP (DUF421 family)